VNAARIDARAAVPTEPTCSSIRRHCACVSASSCVASAAASQPIPARTISIASVAEAGAVLTLGHLLPASSQADDQ